MRAIFSTNRHLYRPSPSISVQRIADLLIFDFNVDLSLLCRPSPTRRVLYQSHQRDKICLMQLPVCIDLHDVAQNLDHSILCLAGEEVVCDYNAVSQTIDFSPTPLPVPRYSMNDWIGPAFELYATCLLNMVEKRAKDSTGQSAVVLSRNPARVELEDVLLEIDRQCFDAGPLRSLRDTRKSYRGWWTRW